MLSSDLPPGLSHLLAHLKCASEWYRWKRYSSHVYLTSFSWKLFYCFQQTGFHKRFSNRVRFVALQFQMRLHMMPVLVEICGKISLRRFTLASWRRKNSITFVVWLGCFVSKCPINFEGFVYIALRAFIPLQCASSWMLTTIPQQQTVGRVS